MHLHLPGERRRFQLVQAVKEAYDDCHGSRRWRILRHLDDGGGRDLVGAVFCVMKRDELVSLDRSWPPAAVGEEAVFEVHNPDDQFMQAHIPTSGPTFLIEEEDGELRTALLIDLCAANIECPAFFEAVADCLTRGEATIGGGASPAVRLIYPPARNP